MNDIPRSVTIPLPETLGAQLATVVRATQDAQRSAVVHYQALPDAERQSWGLAPPTVMTDEEAWAHVLALGTATMLADERYPNSVLALNAEYRPPYVAGRQYSRGETVNLATVSLPIGSELLALTSTPADGPNWDVINLCVGAANLINPAGCIGGLSLSELRYVTTKGLLSAFDHQRTKVDVRVSGNLICKTDGATFDGLRLHLWQEEWEQARGLRFEPVFGGAAACDYSVRVQADVGRVQRVLAGLRAVLDTHTKVWPGATVTLQRSTAQGQEIEVRGLLAPERPADRAATREALMLKLLGVGESCGAALAIEPRDAFGPPWRG